MPVGGETACSSLSAGQMTESNKTSQASAGLDELATRATGGIRTHDLVLTKDALYQLSYSSDTADVPWLDWRDTMVDR